MEMEANDNLYINKAAWAALPPRSQAVLKYACFHAIAEMMASYDAKNAVAIAQLLAAGTTLPVLPNGVVRPLRVATEAVLDEETAANEQFMR